MRLLITGMLILMASPLSAWNGPCYTGTLTAIPFPQESRAMVTLEAKRVVSLEGSTITYDLGSRKVFIKTQGISCESFLKEVKKGNCNAKGIVTVEPDKGSFSDGVGRFRAVGPRAH